MDVVAQLQEQMKLAMKAGDKQRLGVIRLLLNEAKNSDLQKLTPEQAVAAYAKKLRKGVDEYEKLGKPEQAAQLRAELAVAEEFLPAQLSPEETEKLVDAFLAQNSFTAKQVGQAMGAFMKQHGGNADPATVNALLRRKLQ